MAAVVRLCDRPIVKTEYCHDYARHALGQCDGTDATSIPAHRRVVVAQLRAERTLHRVGGTGHMHGPAVRMRCNDGEAVIVSKSLDQCELAIVGAMDSSKSATVDALRQCPTRLSGARRTSQHDRH